MAPSADHAKRAVSTFPTASGPYYGVDYPARRRLESRPDSGRRVPGDRLDWPRNIPVPTSYMCLNSSGDFFGGYDHRAAAGFVHWADHHYAVVKSRDGSVTTSGVTELDDADRRKELSRMLAGLVDSETGLAHADELVELAAQERSG